MNAASIGMGEVFGILGSIFYAVVTMLVMGITLWRARSESAIWIAMLVLLAPIGAILLHRHRSGRRQYQPCA